MISAPTPVQVQLTSDHRGWHSRGYHPHCDLPDLLQSVGFRLADSVPARLVASWRQELGLFEPGAAHVPDASPGNDRDKWVTELLERIARYADAGRGACWLRDERIARLVEDSLLHFDGERYRLLAWCIMPNHVHVLVEIVEKHPLDAVVHSWKSFTAHMANRILGRTGRFWMPDYFDRFIRGERHLATAIAYIAQNPVKAGLAPVPRAWPFSSARRRE